MTRRSSTAVTDDPTVSAMAPIVALPMAHRDSRTLAANRPARIEPDRMTRRDRSPGGAHGGGVDRRVGRSAHLDRGRSFPGDGAVLPRHARAHTALFEIG